MLDEIKFSRTGDQPTQFERRLLAQCIGRSLMEPLAQRLVETLGREKGAEVFCVVLDELGGGNRVTIPTRRTFFQAIWREERDALIVSLASR
ncbi:MAG TPA: hypothetical protein VFQ52_05740, partial [Rhizomicrobium sp.]|nr:hypothetical protein [Rhizomicrobium sp.]